MGISYAARESILKGTQTENPQQWRGEDLGQNDSLKNPLNYHDK